MQSKRKPQINVQMSENLRLIYDATREVGARDSVRLVLAGFLWLLEHPEHQNEAINRLSWIETSGDAPKTRQECEEFVRRLTFGVEGIADTAAQQAHAERVAQTGVVAGSRAEKLKSKRRTAGQ